MRAHGGNIYSLKRMPNNRQDETRSKKSIGKEEKEKGRKSEGTKRDEMEVEDEKGKETK